MDPQLETLRRQISLARIPEDIFGYPLNPGEDFSISLKNKFHSLAKMTHPDLYPESADQLMAQTLFCELTEWYQVAKQKMSARQYGIDHIRIKSKRRTYLVTNHPDQDSFFNQYDCQFEDNGRPNHATLQIVRFPEDNDLALNEIATLEILIQGSLAKLYSNYLPNLIDSFVYDDGVYAHQAEVFESLTGWYSLESVKSAYPQGIHPKDMAWMWRRLLTALGFSHRTGVIHGAILPCNVYILPGDHGLMIKNWLFAVREPSNAWEQILDKHPAYLAWYPTEFTSVKAAIPAADIVLAAKCMLYLLGISPENGFSKTNLPTPIINFFRGCVLPVKRAPSDAWTLLEEFDELITKLWGKRKFHQFKM